MDNVNRSIQKAIEQYKENNYCQIEGREGSSTLVVGLHYANVRSLFAASRKQAVFQIPISNPIYTLVADIDVTPSHLKSDTIIKLIEKCIDTEFDVQEFKAHFEYLIKESTRNFLLR